MSSDKPPRQLPNTALGAGATCLAVLQTWADLPGLGTAASSALFILTYITVRSNLPCLTFAALKDSHSGIQSYTGRLEALWEQDLSRD
jgi:hypothetical protein